MFFQRDLDKSWPITGIPAIYTVGLTFSFERIPCNDSRYYTKISRRCRAGLEKKIAILITVIRDDSSTILLSDPDARISQFSVNVRLMDLSFALSVETVSCSYCFSVESPTVSLAMAFLDVSNILYIVIYLHFLNRLDLYMC